MKKSNIVLSIILVLLVVAGWSVQLLNIAKINAQYDAYLQHAKQFSEAGLYQKAIQSYESALQIKDNKSIRELWIDNYTKAYADKATTYNSYVTALETMCDLYEKDVVYWERLIAVQMENEKVNEAYTTYQEYRGIGVASEIIASYKNDILYGFRINRKPYLEFVRNTTGYYTVKDGQGWGIIRPNGETVYDCVYEYISPYNSNYDALFISEKGQRIADSKAVVQAKVDIDYSRTGAWTNGLLPVCSVDGTWYYLNTKTNKMEHGSYDQASNYYSGKAAVYNGSDWILIDASGKAINNKKFSDIKLLGNGDYQFDGVMVAAENGEYGIYDANGDALNNFRAKDMDVYMGEGIAFCDKSTGKWGMVSKDGNVLVEPSFEIAKSSSNGLAAVSDGELWGFANNTGEIVINHQFYDADYFTSSGLCAVSMTGKNYVFIQLKFFGD